MVNENFSIESKNYKKLRKKYRNLESKYYILENNCKKLGYAFIFSITLTFLNILKIL